MQDSIPDFEDFCDELTEEEEEREVFFNVINRYIALYTRTAHKQTKNDTANEYPFIAMDTRQVFEQIKFVRDYLAKTAKDGDGEKEYTFLDVGCGTGNILLIAEQYGFAVFGIEKDEYPFSIAERLVGEENVAQADIRTFGEYDQYDVIYYFCPFCEGRQQQDFEHRIEKEMKAGAILIANNKRCEAINKDPRFEKLHSRYNIWKKLSL